MTEIQPGNKIAWYGAFGRQLAEVLNTEPDSFGLIKVRELKAKSGRHYREVFAVHPKQCRVLKEKPPVEFYSVVDQDGIPRAGSVDEDRATWICERHNRTSTRRVHRVVKVREVKKADE